MSESDNPDYAQIYKNPKNDIQTSGIQNTPKCIPEHKLEISTPKSALNDVRISLFIDLLYQSSFLPPPSKVLSGVIIAPAGTGKSMNLSKLRGEKSVYYTNIVSPKFLIQFLKKVNNKEKTMIVIPDFLSVTEGNRTTKENLIKLFRVITEEGLDDASHYGYPEVKFDKPARAGLITAITFDGINEFKKEWKQSGFLSRLIPFSYKISGALRMEIEDKLKSYEAREVVEKLPTMKKGIINRSPANITLSKEMAYRLDALAYKLAHVTGTLDAPFRQEKQMYTMAKSHSALRHSDKVEEIDIETITMLSTWLNLEFNVI